MSLTLDNKRTLPASGSQREVSGTSRLALIAKLAPKWAIAFIAFVGAFVINEPAPYELFLAVAMVVFLFFGMRLSQFSISLATLFVMFNIGGLLSMFTMSAYGDIPLYLAVSLFLGLSSVFWCAAIEADMGRLRTIMRGYVVGAVITSLLGIAGYINAFPGADVFTRYDRAMGAFQDPNVFSPFLVLPALYLIYGLLYRSASLAPVRLVLLLVLALGLFLSFSRGAWGLMVLAGGLLYFFLLATETSVKQRFKLLMLGAFGAGTMVLMIVIALQFDAVAEMFDQRAQLTQEYDSAETGRFARHAIGFAWALENPLGIGPLEFGKILGEDTHNIWVKSLMAYGWIGFVSWLIMTLCTLIGGARLIGRIRPWQPYLLCAYAAFIGHVGLGWLIDIDHWRHVYLIIGIIWGCMALEANHLRTQTMKLSK